VEPPFAAQEGTKVWKYWQRSKDLGVPLLTDVHSETNIEAVAAVVDVLKPHSLLVPAVYQRCHGSGQAINIKKRPVSGPW
jgi:2-dehydro-3-deoxyphosphooctonate aldolase (KDO 8-P synthase)